MPRPLRWGVTAAAALTVAGFTFHAVVMHVFGNFRVVVDAEVFRSAQPTGAMLREWTREHGLRTVVNLRGAGSGEDYAEEVRTARELGLRHVDVRWSAVRHAPRPQILRLVELLESAERPLLLHCRAGIDRAGVASVMAAMALGDESYDEALSQFSWRKLRFHDSKIDIGGVLEQYQAYCEASSRSTGGWAEFKRWVQEDYRTSYYFLRIDVPTPVTLAPGERRAVAIKVNQQALWPIPASSASGDGFFIAAFEGTSVDNNPGPMHSEWARLPKRSIEPGSSVDVELTLVAPSTLGVYPLHVDAVEKGVTWFARQGSPMATLELRVESNEK